MDEMIVLTLLLFPGFCGTKEIVTTVASSAFTKGLKSLHSCIFQLSGFQCKLFPFFFFYTGLMRSWSFVLSPTTLRTHV